MPSLIYWIGFLGGWLLVAGPNYQSNLELESEQDAAEALHRAMGSVAAPEPVSAWWWLLPPVRIMRTRRRREAWEAGVTEVMSPDERRQLRHYFDIARGWALVTAGAFLIAIKETYELAHHNEWPQWVFWVLTVVMALTVLGVSGDRARPRRRRLRGRRPGAA